MQSYEERVHSTLSESPAYLGLSRPAQAELAQAMAKVADFLGAGNGSSAVARQLAPDLSQLRPQSNASRLPGDGTQQPAPPSSPPASGAKPAPSGGSGGGAVGRAGEVARATLNAIDFPAFVASLIQGTFQAIVDSSIQQMEAYAELLKNCASTVDRFMSDNISDGQARDYLADQYGGLLSRDTSSGQPRLKVQKRRGKSESELPSFFKDLGFESPEDIDDDSVEQVVVPATRKYLAESRQKTLATMVLMGINRVVVDDGEITAKLQFHIDASETTNLRFDQTKTTAGNMSGYAGRSPFGAQSVMVNTSSLNAQSDINVRADLTGQVKVKFRSETFPLERFADSAAIQLISSNAKVPQAPSTAAAPNTAAGGANATVPAPASTAPAAPAPAAPAPATPTPTAAAHGLELGTDPWAPEV
jgi:hypothetical protein